MHAGPRQILCTQLVRTSSVGRATHACQARTTNKLLDRSLHQQEQGQLRAPALLLCYCYTVRVLFTDNCFLPVHYRQKTRCTALFVCLFVTRGRSATATGGRWLYYYTSQISNTQDRSVCTPPLPFGNVTQIVLSKGF